MLSALSKTFKNILPKTLFWRSLIIIVTPVLLLQIISIYIFIDRHWSKVTDRLAFAVAGEVTVISSSIEANPNTEVIERIAGFSAQSLDLLIKFEPGAKIENSEKPVGAWRSLMIDALEDQLDAMLGKPYSLRVGQDEKWVEISVQLQQGVLRISCLERRLFTSSTYIFLLWMVSASLVLFAIAILFMRNQIRPIRRLAIAAARFGRGRNVSNFKPEGASEVRQAGRAFQDMRNRITRQMDQRTTMLAGVSHDLRTPLTRLKLGLSMLPNSADTQDLQADIVQMEKMLAGYLDFVRGAGQEESVPINLKEFVVEAVATANRAGPFITAGSMAVLTLPLKPLALQRCLANIFENARKYAHTAQVSVQYDAEDAEAVIWVDDDGPGIAPHLYDEVFKPFARLEPSRNAQTGGVGLGLPIALDIVHSHGGALTLHPSPLGGLRVEIRFPV